MRLVTLVGISSIVSTAACAPKPESIYAEPTFDKWGNPSCRPADVPIGGSYTADLPLCAEITPVAAAVASGGSDSQNGATGGTVGGGTDTPTVDDGTTPGTDPTGSPGTDPTGSGNQNQNSNENNNRNRNTNRAG